ncbi:DNA alkylation repair protein [Arthrobacter sp. Br18]|uniref:DNA alkylation repair protein n=1 Tax=Arthrobacter sp. Br18 TaxID=1312954 RepID=UPI000479EBA8|nr:DNA alkylation repair protein [Arthrobacter sp. Br18]
MSDPAGFVDGALQREGSEERAAEFEVRLAGGLQFYGSSVGAVRGTVRDALRRYPGLTHDEITALSSELWAVPVFERRLAAVVLLQSNLHLLRNSDLTRIEGFLRGARLQVLVDPLAVDVAGPLIERLDPPVRSRADVVLDRWVDDDDAWLRRAALLSPLRALRAGGGDWARFSRHARAVQVRLRDRRVDGEAGVDRAAVSLVLMELARARPELTLVLPDG